MSIYDWYLLTDLQDFIDSGFPSKEIDILFPFGLKKVLLTAGNFVSVLYDGVFLNVGLGEENPSKFDGIALYFDADGMLWLGIESES